MTDDRYDLTRHAVLKTPGRRRNEWKAGGSPTAADDSTREFEVGSRWLNATTSEIWTCVSAAVGAAVWKRGTGQAHDELQELGDDDHLQYGLVWAQADPPPDPLREEAIWIDTDAEGSEGGAAVDHLHDADEVAYDDASDYFGLPVSTTFLRPNGDVSQSGVSWTNSGAQGAWQQIDEATMGIGDYITVGPSGISYHTLTDFGGLPTDNIRRVRLYGYGQNGAPSAPCVLRLYDAGSGSAGPQVDWGQASAGDRWSGWLDTCWWDDEPWTPERLALLQIHILGAGISNGAAVYQAYVEVEYDSGITVQAAVEGLVGDVEDHLMFHPSGGGGSGSGVVGVVTARARRTSGDLTLNSTAWANLDTGLDLVVPAQAGDVLAITVSCRWGSGAVGGILDAATIVAGSPVNYISGGVAGASSWGVTGWSATSGHETGSGTMVQYVVQAGDVSGGNVTLRLRYRTSSATNKTLYASSDLPFQWSVANLRQGVAVEMPWHAEVLPVLWTPDATVGTWVVAIPSDVASPFVGNSGGAFFYNSSAAINDSVSWDVVLGAGTWTVTIHVRRSTNTGVITLQLDGVDVGTYDTYAGSPSYAIGTIAGMVVAASGKRRVTVKMASKHASASAYIGNLYALHFRRTA
jgi:hypothetical protein